jgi:Carboxypeptidase regulatory-like domain
MFSRTTWALLVLIILSPTLFGQVSGSISGSVVDPTGAGIPNAKISILLPGGKTSILSAHTSSEGLFFIASVRPDTYDLAIEASGFTRTTLTGLHVESGKESPVPSVRMEVASTRDTVEVVETATAVQTTSPQIANTISQAQIQKLPVIDGQISSIYITQAGVNNGRATTSINGLRPSFTNVYVDGINVQDSVRTNALDLLPGKLTVFEVDEVTISTSNTSPTIGGNATAISIVSPSGQNEYHGTGYWVNRNSYFAANNWFNNRNKIGRPRENLNQLGGAVGGPIIKDKLLFFGAYEAYRDHAQLVKNTTILTPTARQGILQYPVGGVTQQFNVLTAQGLKLDPYMQAEINALPTTGNNNAIGDGLNTTGYSFNARANEVRDNVTGKLDYYLSATNTFSATYKWTRDIVDRPDQGTFFTVAPPVYNNINTKSFTGSWRWNPRPTLTNELRGGLVRLPVEFLTNQAAPKFFATNASSIFSSPINEILPSSRSTQNYSLQDNATWVRGRHTIQFGFQTTLFRNPNIDYSNTVPAYTLGYSATNPLGFSPGDIPGASSTFINTANALQQTLAGIVVSGAQTFNPTSRTSGFVPGAPITQEFLVNNYAPYVVDTWKARRNLTLTLGLRWEYISPVDVKDGLFVQPRVDNGNVVQALLSNDTLDFSGSAVGRPLSKKDLNNFGPNIGFAWDPRGTGKTAIRGGYAITYAIDNNWNDAYNVGIINNGLQQNTGLGNLSALVSSLPAIPTPKFQVPTTTLANYNINPATLLAQAMIDPNLATPYVQQWNAAIQHETWGGLVVEARYVGNHVVKMLRQIDLNQVNIFQGTYLQDFKNARNNGFLALAARNTYDPRYNPAIAGSLPLPFFDSLPSGALLTNSGVINSIRAGEPGTLAQTYQTNRIVPNPSFSFFPNPYLGYSSVLTNYSNSTYDGLTIEVRKRARNLQLQANYTFSKSLSDATATRAIEALLDNNNPGIEKSRTPFDITHSFKLNHDYLLPFGTGQRFRTNHTAVDRVIGGWSLSGFLHIDSGAPTSILSSLGTLNRAARSAQNTVDTNLNLDQLHAISGLFMTGNGPYWIDPAHIGSDGRGIAADGVAPFNGEVFFKPQPGSLGGMQRRLLDGPMYWDYNFGVIKETKITERQSLEFKASFFNLFNHPNFSPNANSATSPGDQFVTSPSFGKMILLQTSGDGINSRAIQFGLRYKF